MSVPPLVEANWTAGAHVVADPGVGGGGQSGAGAADDADGRQVVYGGFDAQLGHGQQVLRTGAEDGDLVTGRQLPQDVRTRLRNRTAVVGAGGGTGQQGGDDQVPHHPVGGGEPQQAVPGAQIGVQAEGLEVFEQDPAVPVDDALGQSGGAGGEDDPQGVVERHRGDGEVLDAADRVLPGNRQPRVPALGPRKAHVVHEHRGLQRRQGGGEFERGGAAVVGGAVEEVAVRGDEHRGFELREAVGGRLGYVVLAAHRPHRAQACGGEEGDDGVGVLGR